jgi:hypothetical protein
MSNNSVTLIAGETPTATQWTNFFALKVDAQGGVLNAGTVTLVGDATVPLGAVTLQQLQASAAAGGGTVKSISASGGTTGLTFAGSPITVSGTLTLGGTLAVASGGTGAASLAAAPFINRAGDTMTGPLILSGNATVPLGAVTLQQLQAGGGGAGSVTSVAASGGTTGLTFAGSPITSTGTLTLGGILAVASGGTGASTAAAAPWLPVAGGTLTGPLILAANPTVPLGATTKQYVDSLPAGAIIGDTAPATPKPGALWWSSVDGQLYVYYQDANSSQWVAATTLAGTSLVTSFNTRVGAVTLTNADITSAGGLLLSGGTMTGALTAPNIIGTSTYGGSNSGLQTAAGMSFVQTGQTTDENITDFLVQPHMFELRFINDAQVLTTSPIIFNRSGINCVGITVSAAITLPADPTTALQAATKQYCDMRSISNVGRNLLHNSMFNIWQRGTGPFAGNTIAADRWRSSIAGGDACATGEGTVTDTMRGQIGDEAATTCLQSVVTGTATAASLTYQIQAIEGVRRLAGKAVTVSFWANSSAALNIGINISQVFGTGGSPSAGLWAQTTGARITTGGTLTRYTATIAMPSIAGMTLGTNGDDYSGLALFLSSGATNAAASGNVGVQSGTVNIWGVQLEIGSTATPLEKPDLQQELAKAQRFFQVGTINLAGYGGAGIGASYFMPFPVPMRASPTVTPTYTTQTNCSGSGPTSVSPAGFVSYTVTTVVGGFILQGSFTASADL